MDATPRFRLFDSSRRGGGVDQEEGAGTAAHALPPRRRMVTSVSVARARRRNRRRPVTNRGGQAFFIRRLLSLVGATNSSSSSSSSSSRRRRRGRRRTVLMLLLAVITAGALVSARLMAWAVSSRWPSPSSSTPFPPLKPPRHHTPASQGKHKDMDMNKDQAADSPRGQGDHKSRRSAVSLGPDAIPSVLLVERRPVGGGREETKEGAEEGPDGDNRAQQQEQQQQQPPHHRCLNTAQGAVLVADSEGRVCRRSEVDGGVHRPGCCSARPPPPPPLPGGAGAGAGAGTGDDDHALAAPDESHIDRDFAAPRSSAAAASAGAGGRALELVVMPSLTKHGGAAAAAAAPEVQPRDDGTREGRLGFDFGFPPEQALSTLFSCWSCDERGNDAGNDGDGGGGRGSGSGSVSGYSSCCRSYEFCVSCCQAPWREEEREAIREAAARAGHPVYRELGSRIDGGGDSVHRTRSPHQLLRGAGSDRSPEEAGEDEEEYREPQAQRTREAAFEHCAFRCRTYSGSVAHENSYRGPLKHCFGRFRPPVAAAAASAGVVTVGAEGQAMMAAGGEQGMVRDGGGGGGLDAPLLQLDPFLAGLQ
eukprot:g7722.t1